MAADPTLIIQLQRMGDLVLTFPLMAWLRTAEPDRPVWVLAEPHFYEELMPFAPDVVFFGPEASSALRTASFHRVINLSHRPTARALAGSLQTALRLGSFSDAQGIHVQGAWQLYRSSIVHNNRHNRFHWADIAALDTVPSAIFPHTSWPVPRPPGTEQRVGLFVGASEAAKRPDATFWGELGAQLARRGASPVFLGGPGDWELAAAAAQHAQLPGANLAGRFTLANFADFASHLDLLVTPDTGPMHVGAWVRVPTLNLSLGPVNAWETSPAVPGHMVVRAEPSCVGCWHCTRPVHNGLPPCHAAFAPHRIATLILATLRGQTHKLALSSLHVLRTTRDARGLFALEALIPRPPRPRDLLGNFWHETFLDLLGGPASHLPEALHALELHAPHLLPLMVRGVSLFHRRLCAVRKESATAEHLSQLWQTSPPLMRPLSGYLQLVLENGEYTPQAWERIHTMLTRMLEHFNLE